MAVYYRSWYYLKNEYTFDRDADQVKRINTSYRHINAFEKQLTDDNYVLLKFFVHVSEKQLKANVQKAEKTYGKGWNKVSESDDDFVDYQRYLEIYEKMFIDSDRPNAHWYLIAGDDTRFAEVSIFDVIVQRLELALAEAEARKQAGKQLVLPRTEIYDVLSKVDLSKEIAKAEYKEKLDKYQSKLSLLQYEMYKKGIPAVFGFEGWDAGGKGGAIRRLTAALDPLGYSVNPVAAPNVVEKEFNYLWRFWTRFPKRGEIAVFDRTWYGRVMVERIEGFATQDEWSRAYAEINEMELQWAEYGTVIGKFWLQIDKDEQYKRFKEREQNPNKEWKITDEDWRNREKWDAYEAAVNEMLVRTSTDYAPWTIVEGNNKYYARLKVLKTVIEMFEKRLKD
jgi:polyphosphate:AMP phosphotransferase